MGYTRKQKRVCKNTRKGVYKNTRKGGAIRDVLTEIRELIKNPNSKYMWKDDAKYEELKDAFSSFDVNTLDPNEFDETEYSKLLQEMRDLQWSNLTEEQKKELRALIKYEQGPTRNIVRNKSGNPMNDVTIENRIRAILERQQPLTEEAIVWRGHARGPKHILPISWFSASSSREIATKFKVGEACCMFKIHLQPGVKVLDLYKVYKSYGIQNPFTEQKRLRSLLEDRDVIFFFNYGAYGEIIVEEGGTFYKDKDCVEKGFKAINSKKTVFETYYFPKDITYVPREGNWKESLFGLENE
jgi:hypothetical protein